MPKITLIEPQKKNPKRFSIFLDGHFAFGADSDLIVNERLIVGKEINSDLLNKLLFESEVGKLMERMYALFSIRQRSENEVRDYLKRLSFKRKIEEQEQISQLVIDDLIEKLKSKGLINDLQFAKAWVEARRKSKQKGIRALKIELLQKGIDKAIVDQTLGVNEINQEEQLAQQAIQKKMKQWQKLSTLEFKKKAYGYLLRKGFEYTIVKSVIEKQLKFVYNGRY